MTALYLARICMRARIHLESLISTLHHVIRILCNQMCVYNRLLANNSIITKQTEISEYCIEMIGIVPVSFSCKKRLFPINVKYSKTLFKLLEKKVISIRLSAPKQ